MGDLALVWSNVDLSADLSVEANDLSRDTGLETAVLLSLFLDKRAEDGDVMPEGETDRRGWWGDLFPVVDGDRIGSRLWLLERAKPTQDTARRTEEYAREALRWLVEDKVVDRLEVVADLVAYESNAKAIVLNVSIFRPGSEDPVRYRFDGVWRTQE